MEKIIITCDLCDKEKTDIKKYNMQVIFETEQNEGRTTEPYFSNIGLDLCKSCYQSIIDERQYISATGAMGQNNYFIKDLDNNKKR